MIFRTDRLFAEAAHSPEQFDRLLRRLKRTRLTLLVIFIVFAILVFAVCSHEVSRLMRYIEAIGNYTLGDKAPASPKLSQLACLTLGLLPFLLIEFASFLHADACVKMLLLHRTRRAGADGAAK